MKIIQIVRGRATITALQEQKLPARLAYKFVRFLKQTETEQQFYRERLHSIMQAHGQKDENGQIIKVDNGIQIKESEIQQCFKEIMELESTEKDDCTIFFTLEELDSLALSVNDMNSLFSFIKDNDDKE